LGNIIKQAVQNDEAAYNASALYQKLWNMYGGDIDAIIDERSIFELEKLARELVAVSKQGMAEATGNIGPGIKALFQKIYDRGDDEIEYFYYESPVFAQYWDRYEGDIDSIIAEVNPKELQIIHDELESYVEGAGLAEDKELAEEFDLIESIVEMIAEHNGVHAEAVWADLESLTEDELYVFAVTSDPLMESEAWQKANKRDRTDGMSRKAVKTYRREHPGSKLQTAVTTKPSKLKKGSKASKRRKSYCSRSRGQMKMHNISCAKTPDKAICKARRRWNC